MQAARRRLANDLNVAPRVAVTVRFCGQATPRRQANPVRPLMLSKLLPFACTAGELARWKHLPPGSRSSPRFDGIFQLLHNFLDTQPTEFSRLEERGLDRLLGPNE